MQLIKIKHLRPRPLALGENSQGLGQREGILQRNGPARPQPCWKVGGGRDALAGAGVHRACRAAPVFPYLLSCGLHKQRCNDITYVLSVVSFMSAGKRRKIRHI